MEEIDAAKARSLTEIARGDLESVTQLQKGLPKDRVQWNSVYKLAYDALHGLAEALLRFDRLKADNHQCLFAALCEQHPELELDWDFFEAVRTKRNGIHYYGAGIGRSDWKSIEAQFLLYIKTLMDAVHMRLHNGR